MVKKGVRARDNSPPRPRGTAVLARTPIPSRRRVASVTWNGEIAVVARGLPLTLPRIGGVVWCVLTAWRRFLLTWDLTFSFSLEMIFSVLGDEIEAAVGVVLSGEAGGLEKDLDSAVSGGGSLLYVWSV